CSSLCVSALRAPHPFPTRRSSDLDFHRHLMGNLLPQLAHYLLADDFGRHETQAAVSDLVFLEPEITFRQTACQCLLQHVQILARSEEHTSELQSREKLVCRLLLEK